jgi:hypothetical protein
MDLFRNHPPWGVMPGWLCTGPIRKYRVDRLIQKILVFSFIGGLGFFLNYFKGLAVFDLAVGGTRPCGFASECMASERGIPGPDCIR